MNLQAHDTGVATPHTSDLDSIVVRFAGDSGDGVQLLGSQFSQETALAGNSLATFPDFPAEIRAPTGTTYGVSAFQINFGSRLIKTAGDQPDVLVALNPAALMVNYKGLRKGGLVILDAGAFKDKDIKRAGFAVDPRLDGTLKEFRVMEIDIDSAPWRDELVTTPPVIEGGDFLLPTAPGWGCDIDERGVARHPPR